MASIEIPANGIVTSHGIVKPEWLDYNDHLNVAYYVLLFDLGIDAFKAGFEVTDAEELMLDDGETIFCFDAVVERKLDIEKLNADADALLKIADKHDVTYDGWGTYFEPREEGEYEEEEHHLND